MVREVLILLTLSSLTSCGTQDYGDDPVAKSAVPEPDWKEAALKAREAPATLIPPQTGGGSRECPDDTLCIRAPFVGAWQFRELASRFPGHLDIKDSDGRLSIRVRNSPKILIEADIFENSIASLILCGKDNTIASSLLQGDGRIDSSGEACDQLDGGNIHLVSFESTAQLSIMTNGKDGAPGTSASVPPDQVRAPSGNPKAVHIEVEKKYLRGRWPIAKLAADGVNENGADDALRHLSDLAQMGLYSEDQLEKHLNQNCSDCEKNADRWYKSDKAGCFFYFMKDGLFDGAVAHLVGEDGLDGNPADPTKIWHGSAGGDGGNAGEIRVITSVRFGAFHSELCAKPGKGGAGGKGAYQLPGLGVEGTADAVPMRITEKHFVGCIMKRNGSFVEVHDWTYHTSRTLDLNFSIGGPQSYDQMGGTSGKLTLRAGREGTALSKEIIAGLDGAVGLDGKASASDIRALTDPDFKSAFHELCDDCKPLKILELPKVN